MPGNYQDAWPELKAALTDLLGQMQQGAYVHMIEHSPSAKEAIAKAEAALGWEPGASYCRAASEVEKP